MSSLIRPLCWCDDDDRVLAPFQTFNLKRSMSPLGQKAAWWWIRFQTETLSRFYDLVTVSDQWFEPWK